MKNFILTLLCMALLSPAAMAQANIEKAFDKLIESKKAEVKASHSIDRNPQTGETVGKTDIYKFSIPSGQMNLIDNIAKAFGQDMEKAYTYESGNIAKAGYEISAGEKKNANIAPYDNSEFYCAFFLDTSRSEPIYRYAYAMSYCEADGKIIGQLTITYSTTLQYRQSLAEMRSNLNIQAAFNSHTKNEDEEWFDKFMEKITGLEFLEEKGSRPMTMLPLIKDIYKISQNCPKTLDEKTRAIACEILEPKIKDQLYQNPTIQKLLAESISNIKK